MRNITANGYKRITKQAARERFNNCESCYMLPCKMNPGNMWMKPVPVPVYDGHNSFTEIVNAFEYYNCNNETGNYTAFYIKMEAMP